MANTIVLAKKYISLLDEVYQAESKTAILDSDASLTRAGANTNEIVIPKMLLDGLGDYDRSGGYPNGDVSLTWETVKFNFDRGRKFSIDAMDDEESMNLAFGSLAGEFERTKVIPELDAFRFAMYASRAKNTVSADLTMGSDVITALRAASVAMDNAEVPAEGRILFITPDIKGLVDDMNTNVSREVLKKFSSIVEVPQVRFYSAIEQLDGKSVGEEKGGFKKAAEGKDMNFLVVHKTALLQYTKHAIPKIIDPAQNQNADAYIFAYRSYGLADVYTNKISAIYAHTATT